MIMIIDKLPYLLHHCRLLYSTFNALIKLQCKESRSNTSQQECLRCVCVCVFYHYRAWKLKHAPVGAENSFDCILRGTFQTAG